MIVSARLNAMDVLLRYTVTKISNIKKADAWVNRSCVLITKRKFNSSEVNSVEILIFLGEDYSSFI